MPRIEPVGHHVLRFAPPRRREHGVDPPAGRGPRGHDGPLGGLLASHLVQPYPDEDTVVVHRERPPAGGRRTVQGEPVPVADQRAAHHPAVAQRSAQVRADAGAGTGLAVVRAPQHDLHPTDRPAVRPVARAHLPGGADHEPVAGGPGGGPLERVGDERGPRLPPGRSLSRPVGARTTSAHGWRPPPAAPSTTHRTGPCHSAAGPPAASTRGEVRARHRAAATHSTPSAAVAARRRRDTTARRCSTV